MIKPPLINPEVKIAISESIIRRDERLSQVQHQIAAGLSAIGLALTRMLDKQAVEGNKEDIQLLSDAGRLLANVNSESPRSRRELIALNLNKELKETSISKLLFGNDLTTNLQIKLFRKTTEVHSHRSQQEPGGMDF